MSKSSDKNIDNLINGLCDDLSPVGKLWCPYRLFFMWSAISLAYLSAVLLFIGVRGDISEKLHEPVFLIETLLCLAFSITGALCASWMTIPDMRGKAWFKAVPITLFLIFLSVQFVKAFTFGFNMPNLKWVTCLNNGFFLQVFPLAFIIFLSFLGKTTQPKSIMFMNVIAVAGVSWIGLRATCPIDDTGYSFLYHYLPITIIGAGLILFARKVFKW